MSEISFKMQPENPTLASNPSFFAAKWDAPKNVKTLITTRHGGASQGVYASLNLGKHVGDNEQAVLENRAIVAKQIPVPMAYMSQVHSPDVVTAKTALEQIVEADASVDSSGEVACVVMTADCLPVLFCDTNGTVVAAAHAGWKGLAAGVLEKTIASMNVSPENILAYMGPAIGPDAFEVGQDVWDCFCLKNSVHEAAFSTIGKQHYLANIYLLATQVMNQVGVKQIYGGDFCTVLEREHFFSYRREGQTGRMVSAIWIEN